jgi:acyl dehydratase
MPELNKKTIGKKYPVTETLIDVHETMYYALATNDPNPYYVDGAREGGIIAPPMYAVKYGGTPIAPIVTDKEVGDNFFAVLLHGEQEIEWFKALKPAQKVKCTGTIRDIEDKGSGELMYIETVTSLSDTGEMVCRQSFNFFVRGYGKLEKKPKVSEPPEDRSKEAFSVKEKVFLGQSYVYAEPSGDHNPIHVDNEFAKAVGLGGIILQGLCTMAFCHKAVVMNACNGNPLKVKKIFVRFSKPVKPGDEITIKGWWQGDKAVTFEATNQTGDFVIRGGRADMGEVRF